MATLINAVTLLLSENLKNKRENPIAKNEAKSLKSLSVITAKSLNPIKNSNA